jgi:hypothetical protein
MGKGYTYTAPDGTTRIIDAETREEATQQTRKGAQAPTAPLGAPGAAAPERPTVPEGAAPPEGPAATVPPEALRAPRMPVMPQPTVSIPPGGKPSAPSPESVDTEPLRLAAQIGAPIAGEWTGRVVGGALTSMIPPQGFWTPYGIVAGGSIGAGGTEYALQKLGISPKSGAQVAITAGIPAAGTVLTTAPKIVKRLGPFYDWAESQVPKRLRELPETLKPKKPSGPLYQETERALAAVPSPPPIASVETQQAIFDIVKKIPRDPTDPALEKLQKIVRRMQTTIQQQTPAGVVAEVGEMRKEMRDLQRLLKVPEAEHLYGGMIRDLEAARALGHPAAGPLRLAATSFRAERGAARLRDLVEQVITEKEGLTTANADRLRKLVLKDTRLRGWIGDAEVDRVAQEIQRRGTISGPRIKFGGRMTPVVSSILALGGGGYGAYTGRGALGTIVAGGALASVPILATLGKETIREMRRGAVNSKAAQVWSILLQGLRAGTAGPAEQGEPEPIDSTEPSEVPPSERPRLPFASPTP